MSYPSPHEEREYKETRTVLRVGIIFGLLIILLGSSYAIRECGNINYLNEECRIITPADTSCTTLDILLDDGTVDVNDGATTLLTAGTGMYYYDYTPTQEGGHCVICIDNNSGCFNVINYNVATQDNISIIQADLDNPDQYKADVSDLATSAEIQGLSEGMDENRTALQDYGDAVGEWGEVAEITDVSNFSIDELDERLNLSHGEGSWETYTEDTTNRIYWLALLIALALFILSKMTETKEFAIFSGIIIVAMAIYSGQYGFYGLDNKFLETVFLIIMWGIGVYLIVKSALDMIKEGGL